MPSKRTIAGDSVVVVGTTSTFLRGVTTGTPQGGILVTPGADGAVVTLTGKNADGLTSKPVMVNGTSVNIESSSGAVVLAPFGLAAINATTDVYLSHGSAAGDREYHRESSTIVRTDRHDADGDSFSNWIVGVTSVEFQHNTTRRIGFGAAFVQLSADIDVFYGSATQTNVVNTVITRVTAPTVEVGGGVGNTGTRVLISSDRISTLDAEDVERTRTRVGVTQQATTAVTSTRLQMDVVDLAVGAVDGIYFAHGIIVVANDTNNEGAVYESRAVFKMNAGSFSLIGTPVNTAPIGDAGQLAMTISWTAHVGGVINLRFNTETTDTVNMGPTIHMYRVPMVYV